MENMIKFDSEFVNYSQIVKNFDKDKLFEVEPNIISNFYFDFFLISSHLLYFYKKDGGILISEVKCCRKSVVRDECFQEFYEEKMEREYDSDSDLNVIKY